MKIVCLAGDNFHTSEIIHKRHSNKRSSIGTVDEGKIIFDQGSEFRDLYLSLEYLWLIKYNSIVYKELSNSMHFHN